MKVHVEKPSPGWPRIARVPVNGSVPCRLPEELRECLGDHPTLLPAGYSAEALSRSLLAWKKKLELDNAWTVTLSGMDPLAMSPVAMVLLLGRDLVLLGHQDARVTIE